MPIGQLQYPEWVGKIEPAGAALARGAQAGATIAGSFTQAYNARKNRELADRELNIREENAKYERIKFGADLYMQSKEQRDTAIGEAEWAAWNAQFGHDPVAIMDAPLPKSDYAAKRASGAKVAASQTTAAMQYAQHITDFNKRVAGLEGDLAAPFYGTVKGYPTVEQWKELGAAEVAMTERKRVAASEVLKEKEGLWMDRVEVAANAKLQVAQTRIQEATARWAGHVNLANFKARMEILKDQSKWMDNAQVIEAADRIWKESFGNEPGAPATNPNPVTPGATPASTNSDPLGLF